MNVSYPASAVVSRRSGLSAGLIRGERVFRVRRRARLGVAEHSQSRCRKAKCPEGGLSRIDERKAGLRILRLTRERRLCWQLRTGVAARASTANRVATRDVVPHGVASSLNSMAEDETARSDQGKNLHDVPLAAKDEKDSEGREDGCAPVEAGKLGQRERDTPKLDLPDVGEQHV